MTIRRVTLKDPVTEADIGRYAFCAPNDPLALCDGPWKIAGLRSHVKAPLVDLQPVGYLTEEADGPTCCSPDTIRFVVDTLTEAKHMLALSRSQVSQSQVALQQIRERIATAVATAIDAAPASGLPKVRRGTGAKTAPKRTVQERKLDAEMLASRWLADGNEAGARGDKARAQRCYDKSQYWLDRAILLAGESDRPAPKR